MVNEDKIRSADLAAGSFSTVGAVLTTNMAVNCSGVRNGVGDVSVTIGTEVDSAQGGVSVTPVGTTFQAAVVEHTSDSVKRVRLFDAAGAAVEGSFYVKVTQHAP